MHYEPFMAFVKNDVDFLQNYYQDKSISFLDYMLALQHEFKHWSVHNKPRKQFTSYLIQRYFSQDLPIEEKLLAQEKFAYALTTISIKLFNLNDNLISILQTFHTSLLENIENSLINQHFSASKKQNLKHLRSKLSQLQPLEQQKKLPHSIRSLPEHTENLTVSDLPYILNDPTKTSFLDCDLILQIYHLPHNETISQSEYFSIIDKTKKLRIKFSEQTSSNLYNCSSLHLINQDIIHALWFNKLNNDSSIELWNHIEKYTIDNLVENFADTKQRKFLFVLTKNGDFVIAPYKQGQEYNRHIMLANGSQIITGGGIEFSKDMTSVISINNGTGHYKSSFDSLKQLKPYLINSHFTIENTMFIDVVTDKQEKVLDIHHALENIKKLKYPVNLTNAIGTIPSLKI